MATQLEDLNEDDLPEDEGDAHEPDEGQDNGDPAEGEDDEGDLITFGDGAPVTGEQESEGVRNLRNRLKEREARIKELEAVSAPKPEQLGPEPDPDDYWDDPEGLKKALREYDAKKARIDEEATEAQKIGEEVSQAIEESARAFMEQRSALRVQGFDAADDAVTAAISPPMLNALTLAAGGKAAALRFFLGTHPDELAKVKALDPRKLTDVIKLAAMAGAMAEKINVTKRSPTTQPERSHAGTSGGSGGRRDATLERLETEAGKSGDRSRLIAYKKEKGLL